VKYSKELRLLKLTGCGDDTWERCINLLTPQVEAEAIQVCDQLVSSMDEPGLMKLIIITLKAVLEAFRLDNAERTKGELVRWLLALRDIRRRLCVRCVRFLACV
jgi:hypothetical protein